MKRILAVGLVLGMIFAVIPVSAAGETYKGYPVVPVYVNGAEMRGSVGSDVPAINMDGRTMVPLRFVAQALGAEVIWDEQTKSVNISKQVNPIEASDQAVFELVMAVEEAKQTIEKQRDGLLTEAGVQDELNGAYHAALSVLRYVDDLLIGIL